MLTILRRLWEAWKPIAHKIGLFQSRVLLTLLYFLLLMPFALFAWLLSSRYILRPQGPTSAWHPRTDSPSTMEDMLRQ